MKLKKGNFYSFVDASFSDEPEEPWYIYDNKTNALTDGFAFVPTSWMILCIQDDLIKPGNLPNTSEKLSWGSVFLAGDSLIFIHEADFRFLGEAKHAT